MNWKAITQNPLFTVAVGGGLGALVPLMEHGIKFGDWREYLGAFVTGAVVALAYHYKQPPNSQPQEQQK
jgi:hypothetical protein